jgi:hypothetical protein
MPILVSFPISFSSFFRLYTKIALCYAVKHNSPLYMPAYDNVIEEITIRILLDILINGLFYTVSIGSPNYAFSFAVELMMSYPLLSISN